MKPLLTILIAWIVSFSSVYAQQCTLAGQTPATAIAVCANTILGQNKIPRCKNGYLFAPGCNFAQNFTDYADRNPFWYRFTCSKSGSLEFVIRPNAQDQDFDWDLFDITGHSPDDVYTDSTLVIAGNWAGNYGETGATAAGNSSFHCSSTTERFSSSPALIEGHQYLLLVSCFTSGDGGLRLAR